MKIGVGHFSVTISKYVPMAGWYPSSIGFSNLASFEVSKQMRKTPFFFMNRVLQDTYSEWPAKSMKDIWMSLSLLSFSSSVFSSFPSVD